MPSFIESSGPFPVDARPVTDRAMRLDEVRWASVFALILTQFAGGMHLVHAILDSTGTSERLMVLNGAAAGVLFLSLGVRVVSGRPRNPLPGSPGLIGFWSGWESISFITYAGLALFSVWRPGMLLLSALTAVAGFAAIFCSAKVYPESRRPAWAARIVFTKFFGTALLLGATGSAVWSGWCFPTLAPALAMAATVIRTLLFGWEWSCLLKAGKNADSPTHHSARIMFDLLRPVLVARMGLFAASTVFSMLAIFDAAHHGAVWGSIACFTTVTSQLLERYTFFAASPAPQFPDGNSRLVSSGRCAGGILPVEGEGES